MKVDVRPNPSSERERPLARYSGILKSIFERRADERSPSAPAPRANQKSDQVRFLAD